MISKMLQVLRMASPLAVAVALLFSGGNAGAAQAVVSGEFVGAIPNSDPKDPPGGRADELVAVIVNDAGASGRRAIRVYICDSDPSGEGDAEWFTGIIIGDTFDLESVDGDATAQGQLTEAAVTGTVSLPDGRTLSFRAVPARAGAGFYDVFILANGTKQGVSPSGNTHTSRVISQRVQGIQTIKQLANTIRILEGPTIRYRSTLIQLRRAPIPGQTKVAIALIVLPNADKITGRKGAGRGADIKSSAGFTSWLIY